MMRCSYSIHSTPVTVTAAYLQSTFDGTPSCWSEESGCVEEDLYVLIPFQETF